MSDLQTLWDISDESFRCLLELQLSRRYVSLPGEEATPSEIVAPMLGDELIPDPDRVQMRATNIDVPAGDVWPWLAQMMRGAGIYGWPRLENARCSSADTLLRDVPPPQIGDRVGDLFELITIDEPRAVVWRSSQRIRVVGLTVHELTLSYRLTPLDQSSSRLVARQRCLFDQPMDRLTRRLSNLIHFLLPCSQLQCIKCRAEAAAANENSSSEKSNAKRHQAAPFHRSVNGASR